MRRHDPERAAAAYLGGELTRRRRERFESHILGCDDCWREVTAGRRGRTLAETLREIAPQQARERIRAVAATVPEVGPRGWPGLRFPLVVSGVALVALLVAGVLAGMLLLWYGPAGATQPAPLTAAVATYQQPDGGWSATAAAPPVSRIGGLTWRGASARELGGQPATVHLYADDAGRRLLVARSGQPFPDAAHVDPVDRGPSWVATVDGAVLFCADEPKSSWLAIGATREQVLAAGRALGLR